MSPRRPFQVGDARIGASVVWLPRPWSIGERIPEVQLSDLVQLFQFSHLCVSGGAKPTSAHKSGGGRAYGCHCEGGSNNSATASFTLPASLRRPVLRALCRSSGFSRGGTWHSSCRSCWRCSIF